MDFSHFCPVRTAPSLLLSSPHSLLSFPSSLPLYSTPFVLSFHIFILFFLFIFLFLFYSVKDQLQETCNMCTLPHTWPFPSCFEIHLSNSPVIFLLSNTLVHQLATHPVFPCPTNIICKILTCLSNHYFFVYPFHHPDIYPIHLSIHPLSHPNFIHLPIHLYSFV